MTAAIRFLKSQVFFATTMINRISKWLSEDDRQDAQASSSGKKRTPPEKLVSYWRRMVMMVMRVYMDVLMQSAMDYLMSRNQPIKNAKSKDKKGNGSKDRSKAAANQGKVRRGIGNPLPRSRAHVQWNFEPKDCVHDEDRLRQRGAKDSFWWTCLDCGARWERVEWAPDKKVNEGKAMSSTDGAQEEMEEMATSTQVILTNSTIAYPEKLPPPKSRPELNSLVIAETHQALQDKKAVQEKSQMKDAKEFVAEVHLDTALGETPTTEPTADQKLDHMLRLHAKETRKKMASGVRPVQPRSHPRTQSSKAKAEAHEIHSSGDELLSPESDFKMLELEGAP